MRRPWRQQILGPHRHRERHIRTFVLLVLLRLFLADIGEVGKRGQSRLRDAKGLGLVPPPNRLALVCSIAFEAKLLDRLSKARQLAVGNGLGREFARNADLSGESGEAGAAAGSAAAAAAALTMPGAIGVVRDSSMVSSKAFRIL